MKDALKIYIFIFLVFSSAAHGQVFRCDVNGKVVFSDVPCQAGQKGQLIQERKSSEEIYQDRLRALEAERTKQERYHLQREREHYERSNQASGGQRGGEPVVIRNQYQNLPSPQETWSERNDRRNREVTKSSITNNGGRWDEKAARERQVERDRNTYDCDIHGGVHATCRPRR
jgi:hypothetical protein